MNIGKIDAERNKQEKNAYAAIIRRHMEFSMEGDETEQMNKPCLGRCLHDESLFPEAAEARWHTSTSYHHASTLQDQEERQKTKD